MLPIAVDAMGGDNAPSAIVAGARRASEENGIPVVLVGQPDALGDVGEQARRHRHEAAELPADVQLLRLGRGGRAMVARASHLPRPGRRVKSKTQNAHCQRRPAKAENNFASLPASTGHSSVFKQPSPLRSEISPPAGHKYTSVSAETACVPQAARLPPPFLRSSRFRENTPLPRCDFARLAFHGGTMCGCPRFWGRQCASPAGSPPAWDLIRRPATIGKAQRAIGLR